jgi:peptidoglycan/xylan/chitin deacetylase (PgdA/CDA1 family)
LDDGYLSNLNHALPVLKHFGFSATCYAVSGLLGQHNQWDEALGIVKASLMSPQDLKTWVDAGMEIGSHTRHHADLTLLSLDEVQKELVQSKVRIQKIFYNKL